MPLLTTSVPNLVQGVSQQPDNLRHPGQAESQTNALSSVVDGLTKRPNTDHVKVLSSGVNNNAKVHVFDRDSANKHLFLFANNGSNVTLIAKDATDGDDIPVLISSDAQAYLNYHPVSLGVVPEYHLSALSVADYTFVSNNQKVIAEDSATSTALDNEAIVFVRQGDYEKAYTVTIDGTDYSITSGAASSGGDEADTSHIASELESALGASGTLGSLSAINVSFAGSGYTVPPSVTITGGGGNGATAVSQISTSGVVINIVITNAGSGYTTVPTVTIAGTATATAVLVSGSTFSGTVTRESSVLKISSSSSFVLTVSDGLSDTGLGLVYKEVNHITNLPAKCFNGHRVKVRGDIELSQDDYYVKFVTKDDASFGEGSWEEDIGYGVKTSLDKTTLPIEIVPTFKSFVIHGGNVYKALSNHTSASGNEPGTGGGAAYWELDTSIKAAEAWSASSVAYVGSSNTVVNYAVQTATWTNRLCGDDDTNSSPSFVGKKINDMFFYKNRLGFLTDSTVVFSEADKYFNFYRTTVLSLLDSAPIDVGLAHTKITTLRHAVAFQEKLVLFSDNSQFVLKGNQLLTPKTVNISPVTEYELKDFGVPLAMTNFIYFPYPKSSYTGVYEYYVDSDSDTYDASDLTAQVPAYVPSDVYQLIGSPSENVLIGIPTSSTELYVYKYFWQGKDKIQSSWSKFTFSNTIRGLAMLDSILYLIIWDGTNLCLETLDFSTGQVDSGKTYKILLDRRVAHSSLTRSYNASSKITTVSSMPYDPANAVIYTKDGARHVITRTSASAFTVNGDITPYVSHGGSFYRCLQDHTSSSSTEPGTGGGSAYWTVDGTVSSAQAWSSSSVSYRVNDFFVGREYDMEYEFSTQTLKQPTERGGRSTSDFTNQILRNGAVEYSDTGHFTIEVTPQYRDSYSYAFNPSILGSDSTIGSLVLDEGSFRFPIHCKHDDATIKIKSSSALPMKVLSAEFENFIHARSRRYA